MCFLLATHRSSRFLASAIAGAIIGTFSPCGMKTALAAQDLRSVISLNGQWQTATVADSRETPPETGWASHEVPGIVWVSAGNNTPYLWYRRDVDVPADWSGRRIILDVRGARYAPEVFVDGHLAARQENGWAPFQTDITSLMTPGRHQLAIRCQDRSAGRSTAPDSDGRWNIPLGGYGDNIGLWDNVELRAVPQDYLDQAELEIVPSVRQGTLTLHGKVVGSVAGMRVAARVLDRNTAALTLADQAVNADGSWTLQSTFLKPHLWSPEDPHLYEIEVTLQRGDGGSVIDRFRQRFGFKEFWTSGADFYLNGVKRHILASSTWPNTGPESPTVIRERVRAIRAGNVLAFRLHNSLWQEEWLRAADEAGLLIVDETPLYGGPYAYKDPKFWDSMRQAVSGMIRRDRNHPSLIMWSLGNEILFMNNQSYDANLPKELGALGRYAKRIDPHHPITMEADLDPDNAFDVIGLHYPHEMPWEYDYPNTADWLGARVTTQAAGGMLGNRSVSFFWERKKPLYIGEYLWVPQGDYSDATIWFGDDAYLNRDIYHTKAQARAFYDQTLGYRRSGVSGVAPWTAFAFGAVLGDKERELYDTEKDFYRPIAAFLRTRALRFFSRERTRLTFDVFNDGASAHTLTVRALSKTGQPLAEVRTTLQPGDYQEKSLLFEVPAVSRKTAMDLQVVLLSDGKEIHRDRVAATLYPRTPLSAPAGMRVIVFDPRHKWPGSVVGLTGLGKADPSRTILVIAQNAFGGKQVKSGLPVIGADTFDPAPLRDFLDRGGRVVALEQTTLAPLGLDLSLVGHKATMTFPLRRSHPVLKGVSASDLAYWRDDNYVTRFEIKRPQASGARAVTVSGGPDVLDQSPIVEASIGRGRFVAIQALAGEKYDREPVARQLVQNAVDYLAGTIAPSQEAARIATNDPEFVKSVSQLGVSVAAPGAASRYLLLSGGGNAVTDRAGDIATALKAGGVMYWHMPDALAFDTLKGAIGAAGIKVQPCLQGPSLLGRDDPLLSGVSREDLNYSIADMSWDRKLTPLSAGATAMFLPAAAPGAPAAVFAAGDIRSEAGKVATQPDGRAALTFDRRGVCSVTVHAPAAGLYPIILQASGKPDAGSFAQVRLDVNGHYAVWLSLDAESSKDYTTVLSLPAGSSTVSLNFTNGSEYGGGRTLAIGGITLGARMPYPPGMRVLALPATVIAWNVGKGTVVLDGTQWYGESHNTVKGARWANALLSNLGIPFVRPAIQAAQDTVPLSAFKLAGESPYYAGSASELLLRSNGTVQAKFTCATAGEYRIWLDGSSTSVQGVFARARVTVGVAEVRIFDVASSEARKFDGGKLRLSAGEHTIAVSFINDASANEEDRNLSVKGISLARMR